MKAKYTGAFAGVVVERAGFTGFGLTGHGNPGRRGEIVPRAAANVKHSVRLYMRK